MSIKYRCTNTRKCYWLCLDCLRGHSKCSLNCPGYLSIARVKKLSDEQRKEILRWTGNSDKAN